MITKDEVVPLLIEACPSFTEPCQQTLEEHGDLLYIVAGEFAHHLLALWREGDHSELSAAGAFLEKLHLEGDTYVVELATIGFLEGIQNVLGNNSVDPEQFAAYLGTETRRWWRSLNRFWNMEIRYWRGSIISLDGRPRAMRCRTRCGRIEDRLEPYDALIPCGAVDRAVGSGWERVDGAVTWTRSARGPWRH